MPSKLEIEMTIRTIANHTQDYETREQLNELLKAIEAQRIRHDAPQKPGGSREIHNRRR